MRSIKPLWWLLFAAGGTIAAFVVPVHVTLLGIVLPAGLAKDAFTYDRMLALVSHPLTRLYLFVTISLSFFHWAHRFLYTLAEGLHLKTAWLPLPVACYGSAIAGTVLTAILLARL